MKLFYSPYFTGAYYRNLPVGTPCFEKIVGDAGLLEWLEVEFGIFNAEDEAIDRILAYRSSMDACKADAFYRGAFENDQLATAKEILRWRDVLVMDGFEAGREYKSSRLQKLAEVERLFNKVGTPERWKKVHSLAKDRKIEAEIEVCYDLSLLPALIRETLKALGVAKGRHDGLAVKDLQLDAAGKDISIYQFGTVAEAYRWAVEENDCEAVICPDPFRLNAVLRNKEKSVMDASSVGDSTISQLFRLGLSLLEQPLNIKNLLEYLRTEFSPVPGGYVLAEALKRDGGLGEKWQEAVSACKDQIGLKKYLLSLLHAKIVAGKVSASVVTDWCKAMEDWSKAVMTEAQKSYLQNLAGLCRGMCRVVEMEGKNDVDVEFVLKAVKTLYAPGPVKSAKAMAGSWEAVISHHCFVDTPKSLLWVPCNGGLGTAWPYDFLLQEEIEELKVGQRVDFVKYDFNLMVDLLGKAERIALCPCDYDCDEALSEHPAVTLCKPAAKEVDKRPAGDSVAGIFTPLRTIETGVDLYPMRKQKDDKVEKEISLSATSIDTLIGYPFDFVMDKKLGFQDLSSLQLSDLTLTEGNVSHYVFEQMLDNSKGDIASMRKMLAPGTFEKRVDSAAREKGAALLLPENRTLFDHFKETIQKSIGILLDILEASGLEPKKSEEKLDQELGFSHIVGSVDFYAETKGGDIVVIDFKYSKGKHYIEKLDADKSIQLEIYAQGLEDKLHKNVVARGYYFFPINQLHTDDETGLFKKGYGVFLHKKKPNPIPLSKRIEDSVALRTEQLKAGMLEMEEGSPLEEIEYHKKASDGSLIDIPADMQNKQNKAGSPFVTPTKYPILKDSIK